MPPSASAPGPSDGSITSAQADPGLFSIITGDSGVGLTFQYDAQTTASVGADPDLARIAAGLAIGLYTVQGQQPATDFAIVSVVHVRDRTFGDEWYRQYRDSYDVSACAQAGGVARNAQATLGGHTVFIGACAGGAFTFHVRVRDGAIIVSITSLGPARLGDRLAADVDQP